MVSVIIPFYNRAKFLEDALNSVLAQTYTDWECIIVDDGSTDNSKEIAIKFSQRDSRFKYIYQTNKGASAARNAGLNEIRGDWVQFLDSDDIIEPEKLKKQILTASKLPVHENIIMYSGYKYGKEDNIYEELPGLENYSFISDNKFIELIAGWEDEFIIPIHSFLFSSNFFKEEGIRFDTSLINHVDFDVWLKIFSRKINLIYSEEILCRYRLTGNSLSTNMRLMGEGFLRVLENHISGYNYPANVISALKEKKLKVLRNYKRFDLMTFSDKVTSFSVLRDYYFRRILGKIKGLNF